MAEIAAKTLRCLT
jgi:hypothetical protein